MTIVTFEGKIGKLSVLRTRSMTPNYEVWGGSITLWAFIVARVTVALLEIDCIMRTGHYLEILNQNLKTSGRKFSLGWKSVF